MLDQIRAKSAQTAALAKEKASALSVPASLKEASQRGSQALQLGSQTLQAQARTAAQSLQTLKKPPSSSSGGSRVPSEVSTDCESDLECGGSPTSPRHNQEADGLLDEFTEECRLSKKQRLLGALSCYAFGALCGFLSTLMLWGGPRHVKQFAFFYTVSSLSGIGSSLFLVGPRRQLQVMCMPVRRVACCIWLGAMTLTLIIAFSFPRAAPIVMLLVIVQYVAMLWYGASFVPYGRAMLKKCGTKLATQVNGVV